MKQKILEVVGIAFMILVVVVAGVGLFMAFVWDPSHRPVVVLPGADRAPWSIDVDGKTVCASLAAPTDEQSIASCELKLGTGKHTLVARGAGGAEVHRAEVTIERGESCYLWAPEIPKGQCVRIRDEQYTTGPQIQLPGFLAPPDKFESVEPGFKDVGSVDVWFKEPPATVQTQKSDTSLRTVRLEPCVVSREPDPDPR